MDSEAGFGVGQPLSMLKAANKNKQFLNNSFMPEQIKHMPTQPDIDRS
jgi:hypothetical protein